MNTEIPDTELMAEKLGMIVICNNCQKRLKMENVLRIPVWVHENNNSGWCYENSEEFYAAPRSHFDKTVSL